MKTFKNFLIEQKEITWNSRPNLNGNTSKDFQSAGRNLHKLAQDTKNQ